MWVVGYRIGEYYKVRENTKRILKVQLIRKGSLKSERQKKMAEHIRVLLTESR